MKRQRRYIYSLILLFSLSIYSCEKERVYPRVQIETTGSTSSYAFGDTIYVTATVENASATPLLQILQGETVVALPAELFQQNGVEYQWRVYYRNKYLSGGLYDIRVSAVNGEANSSDFQAVRLQALDLELRGLSLLSKGSSYTLHRLDSLGQASQSILSGPAEFLANRSEFRQIYLAPAGQGALRVHQFKNLEEKYRLSEQAPVQGIQYRQLYAPERQVIALHNDGRILSLGSKGEIIHSFSLPAPHIPLMACMSNSGLIVLSREGSSPQYHLWVLNPTSGYVIRQSFINFTPRQIKCSPNGQSIFIIGNKNDQMICAQYSVESNSVSQQFSLPGERAVDLALSNSSGILLTDQQIYLFDINNPLFPQSLLQIEAQQAAYEREEDIFYFRTHQTLYQLRPASPSPLYVYAQSDTLLDFDFMYNK